MKTQCIHSKDSQNYTKSLQGKKIYKDQCVKCFHQPKNQNGLYVCMKCFNGFCPQHRDSHTQDHKHPLFINIIVVEKQVQEKHQITKLAIGKQGGALGGPEYQTTYHIYCSLCKTNDFQGSNQFQPQIQSLANTQSPFKKQAAVSWQVQINLCQHSLTLQQNPQNKDISKCLNCQLSTNLWLCLTCGNVGCGRGHWDGSSGGGNNHGVEHYKTSNHPLAVKLGTITPKGEASIYCYACNQDVRDDKLPDHLSVLGIEVSGQKKTQKTITELNIDLNLNFSLSRLVEKSGEKSKPLYGPGYTGMDNIGNSCYLNSVVQVLNSIPQFINQYYIKGTQHMKTCKRLPSNCFYCQISKVFWGLNSGKYSQRKQRKRIINQQQHIQQYQDAIKPYDFKLLIAKQHPQFTNNHQQDALEYLQWLFSQLQEQQPKYGEIIPKYFQFQLANQMICQSCNGIKIATQRTNQWKFPILAPSQTDINLFFKNLQTQTNQQLKASKLCQDPQYPLTFQSCKNIMREGTILQVKCSSCKKNTQFLSHNLFKSTPKYLLMIPHRFIVQNFIQKKLNAVIQMPEQLDISQFLLSNSKAKGEPLLQLKQLKYSEESLNVMLQLGNQRNASIRALIANNDNVQAAMNWIYDNPNQNLSDPIQQQDDKQEADDEPNNNTLNQIMELGFDKNQAIIALKKNKFNQSEAVQWLFNCGGDVSSFKNLLKPKKQKQKAQVGQLHEKYRLAAVIIHLGKTATHGHYVSYIKKQGQWVLFNDNAVTVQKQPVLGKGYIYLYESI